MMHEAWQQITRAPKKQESIPHFNLQVLNDLSFFLLLHVISRNKFIEWKLQKILDKL